MVNRLKDFGRRNRLSGFSISDPNAAPEHADFNISAPAAVLEPEIADPDDFTLDKEIKLTLDMGLGLEIPLTDIENNFRQLTRKPQPLIPGTIEPPGLAQGRETISTAPERSKWKKFKGFFVGKRNPLPPDADRIERLSRAFDIGVSMPLRTFLKFGKGMTLNAPDMVWALIKRITPDDVWDEEVKNMTLDEAMDWAGGYTPSGFQKGVGELAEFMGRLKTVAPIAQKIGVIGNTPKSITALEEAFETAKLFGAAAVAQQVSAGASDVIDPTEAEYGFEGPKAVLRDMAIGAILSLAHSGAKGLWSKLTPSEEARALKILGLKEGASQEEITRAANSLARQYHPDKAKGYIEEFKKVIKARDLLRQGEPQDIVFRGQKVTIKPKLLPETPATAGQAGTQATLSRQTPVNVSKSMQKPEKIAQGAASGKFNQIQSEQFAGPIGAKMRAEELAKQKPAEAEITPTEKQPWQMTREEYDNAVKEQNISQNDKLIKHISKYQEKLNEQAEDIPAYIGLRFADKKWNKGDIIDIESKLMGDDRLEYAEYGTKEYEEAESMGGVSTWDLEYFDLDKAKDKGEFAFDTIGRKYAYILGSDSTISHPYADQSEAILDKPVVLERIDLGTLGGYHSEIIEKALSEGKPVPPEVLAEYPDLKPSSLAKEPAKTTTEKVEPITKEEKNQLRSMGYSVPDILKMDRTQARKKITDNYIKHIDNPKHEAGFVKVPIPESVQEAAQRSAERAKIAAKNAKEDIDKFRFYPNAPPEFRNDVRKDLIGGLNKASKNVYEIAQDAIWGGMDKAEIEKSVEILYARDQLSRTKLGKGNPEIDLEQSQEILDTVMKDASPEAIAAADRYRAIVDKYTQKLIDRGVLEEGRQIQDYVRHYVEDYTPAWAPYANIPTRLKRPFRGYTKKATGTTKAYRQDQESLLASMMEMEYHNLIEDFVETQVKKFDIKPKMSKELRRELFGTDARGYAKTPRPGRIYIVDGKRYRAYTPDIPFSRAIYMTENGEAAIGSFKNVALIPEEIYNTFRDFSERGSRGIYLVNRATGYWKSMAILSHFPSFNVNNMVGDTWMAAMQHPNPLSLISELDTSIRYLTGKLEPKYAKQLDDFISKHDIKQTFFRTEIMAARNSKNPLNRLLTKARDVSDFRESIMRVAYASSLLKAQQRGQGVQMVEAHNWIDTEGLNEEDALGKIAREVLVDYAAQSKTFRRFVRGGVAPFGTWYFKASRLIWNWFSKHPLKATLSFMSLPIAAAAYNNRNEKTQKLESQLPDFIRNRTHFVLGENADGTVRTLSLQLPQDVLIGTKIFSIATDYGNRVINGEMTAEEAAKETLKTWGIREYEGAKYLLTPFIRLYAGLKTGKDPYDKAPVYRREYERLTAGEKARDIAAYIVKTSVPFLGATIQTYEKGLPQDVAIRKLMDQLAGKGALGIYDFNKKGQIVIDGKDGKKTTIEFADVEKIRKLAIQEYKYLGQIEDAWVASDLEIEDFARSEMLTEPLAKLYDQYAKRIDLDTTIDNVRKARIISDVLEDRLINRLTLPRIKQKRLQVQLSRAKTKEQKQKLAEEYKKVQQERLEEIIKAQPSSARDIELTKKIREFLK